MNQPPNGPASDYTDTIAYKLLAGDPNARVVVSCGCSSLFFTHPVAMCYVGLKSMEDRVLVSKIKFRETSSANLAHTET